MRDGRRRGRGVTRRRVLLTGGAAVSAVGMGTGRTAGIGAGRAAGATTRRRATAGSNDGWSTYQGNVRRTGRTASIGKPAAKHWAVGNASEGVTVPTVVGDRIYLGVDDRLLGLAPDGNVEWAYSAPAAIERSVTVADGTVFVPTTDGRLVAVDREEGEEQWRTGTNRRLTPPAVDGGTVLVGSKSGTLFAFDAESGDLLWRHAEPVEYSPGWLNGVPSALYPTAAVADGTAYAHFPLGDRTKVVAFATEDGTVRWSHEIPDETQVYPPVVGEEGLYLLGGEFVTRLSRTGGVQQWRVSTAVGKFSLQPPALGDTHLFASSYDNDVVTYFGIERDSGEIAWEYETEQEVVNGVSTDGSLAYFVADGTLVAVNGESGLERWRYSLGTDAGQGYSPVGIPGSGGVLLKYDDSVLKLGARRTAEQAGGGTDRVTPTESVESAGTATEPAGSEASGEPEGGSDSGSDGSGGFDVSLTTIESVVVITSSVLGGLYTVVRLLGD